MSQVHKETTTEEYNRHENIPGGYVSKQSHSQSQSQSEHASKKTNETIQQGKETIQHGKEQLGEKADQAKETVKEKVNEGSQKADTLIQTLGRKVSDFSGNMKDQASSAVEKIKQDWNAGKEKVEEKLEEAKRKGVAATAMGVSDSRQLSQKDKWLLIGVACFTLWGVLHMMVGITALFAYVYNGNDGVIHAFYENSVKTIHGTGKYEVPLTRFAHVALNFGIDLIGFGILGIWGALMILRRQQLGYYLNLYMLGIADGAFAFCLLLPGYSPLLEGLAGPILYCLGVYYTRKGFWGKSNQ